MANLARAWLPGVVVALVWLVLLVGSPSDAAILLGSGLGTLASPLIVLAVLITGLLARRWWQAVAAAIALALLNRLLFISPLEARPVSWEMFVGVGAVAVSLVIIALIAGTRDGLAAIRRR